MKMNIDKKTATIAIIIIVICSSFIGSLLWLGNKNGTIEQITIAEAQFESTALVWIAEEKGFFRQNGLNITSIPYTSGVGALDGLLNGNADIAVGTNEFPLVGRALQQENIRTIGCISKSIFIYLVSRKDRGIEEPTDLIGKKIGTTYRTIAEFFLSRFLVLNGINQQDTIIVDLKTPAEWVNAVVNGTVDAVVTAQPYAYSAKNALGDNATIWSVQSGRPLYTQIISTNDWITNHTNQIDNFLRSIMQAEEYLILYPEESQGIIQKRLQVDDGYLETIWSQNQFTLSLDQSLITAMEDEARWIINNNLTNVTTIPDFLNYIYVDALRSIKPEAVNIIT